MLLTYFLDLHLNPEFISKGGTENKKLLSSSVRTFFFTLIIKVTEPWRNIYSEHKVSHICSLFSPFTQVVQKFHSKANTSRYLNFYFLVYYSVYKYFSTPLTFKLLMNTEYTGNIAFAFTKVLCLCSVNAL